MLGPPPQGVQHKVPQTKRLRDKALLTGKHRNSAWYTWGWCAKEYGPRAQRTVQAQRYYEELEDRWSREWDLAEKISREAKVPFTNRWGERENETEEDTSNFGRAIKKWRTQVNKDYIETHFP